MCGHDIDSPSCPLAREQVLHLLNLGLTELKTNILPNIRPRGSEEAQFMATQEFSFKLAKAIRNYLNSSPEQFLSAISEASN